MTKQERDKLVAEDEERDRQVCAELEWAKRALQSNRKTVWALRDKLQEMCEHIAAWPETQARTLTVEDARMLGICRLCKKEPTMPLQLNYGKEYACLKCLEAAGCIDYSKEAL